MTRRERTAKDLDFDQAMKKLEEIVRRLEEEEISLEASLKLYEEGLALQRMCESKLRAAENRIRQLTENAAGELVEEDLEPASGAAALEDDQEESDADESVPPSSPPAPSSQSEDDLPF